MDSAKELDIKILRGLGEKTAEKLNKIGIYNIEDLIHFYPRAYEDWTALGSIKEIYESGNPGCMWIQASSTISKVRLANGKRLFKIQGSDGTDSLDIIFFNNYYVALNLVKNEKTLIRGNVTKKANRYEIISPKIYQNTEIRPIYAQTKFIHSERIKNLINQALKTIKRPLEETLPDFILKKYDLCSLDFAIKNIHFPKNLKDAETAKKRLIFEEVLVWQIAVSKIKNYVKRKTDIKISNSFCDEFLFLLPFMLTKAQTRVINECMEDMMDKNSLSMSRLIQGDVGSGKTVVAAAATYAVIKNGYQVAIMVPTEILSVQHYNTLNKIFQGTNINIALLSGKLRLKERKNLENKIKNKEINLVIGTHALMGENLEFAKLGLVVTDEQHRFGVKQRMRLAEKGQNPHVLIMSATPIPRTLSMMVHGDLDISILDELPPGRKEVQTFCVSPAKKERAFNFFKKIIKNGGQGYIVCPLIENSDSDMISVDEYKNKILKKVFAEYNAEILHGKLSRSDKEKIMQDFSSGKIQILVSTTVIEVGVDVPNASVIIIENAERFGISQLHQLRGRVGRGEKASYCILISSLNTKDTQRRMKALCSTNDGFLLAEEDLKIRGPGEIFGNKQHGMEEIKLAKTLKDIKLLEVSKKVAREILSGNYLKEDDFKIINWKVNRVINKTQNCLTI